MLLYMNLIYMCVQTVITSRYMLEYLVEARGPQLTSLSLATNILVKFDVVMQSIMVSVPAWREMNTFHFYIEWIFFT